MLVQNQVMFSRNNDCEGWSEKVSLIHPGVKDGLYVPPGCFCRNSDLTMIGGASAPFILSATALMQIMEWHKCLSIGQIDVSSTFHSFNLQAVALAAAIDVKKLYPPTEVLINAELIDGKDEGREKRIWLTPKGLSRWICVVAQQNTLMGRTDSTTTHIVDLSHQKN